MRNTSFNPPNLKFKTYHKQKIKNIQLKKSTSILKYGSHGIKAIECGFITPKQYELARRILTKFIGKRKRKKKTRIWNRLKINRPITRKPRGVRMGQGKGNVQYWVSNIQAGKILWELPNKIKRNRFIYSAVNRLQKILPMKTKYIRKNFKSIYIKISPIHYMWINQKNKLGYT